MKKMAICLILFVIMIIVALSIVMHHNIREELICKDNDMVRSFEILNGLIHIELREANRIITLHDGMNRDRVIITDNNYHIIGFSNIGLCCAEDLFKLESLDEVVNKYGDPHLDIGYGMYCYTYFCDNDMVILITSDGINIMNRVQYSLKDFIKRYI